MRMFNIRKKIKFLLCNNAFRLDIPHCRVRYRYKVLFILDPKSSCIIFLAACRHEEKLNAVLFVFFFFIIATSKTKKYQNNILSWTLFASTRKLRFNFSSARSI